LPDRASGRRGSAVGNCLAIIAYVPFFYSFIIAEAHVEDDVYIEAASILFARPSYDTTFD